MARKTISKNLKPLDWLKYLDKGGNDVCDKEAIIALCTKNTQILDVKIEVEHD